MCLANFSKLVENTLHTNERVSWCLGLDGNNANRFMSLLDVLERDVTITAAINILPIIKCLRKFSLLKLAVFGLELGTDISVKIEDFKSSFCSLN